MTTWPGVLFRCALAAIASALFASSAIPAEKRLDDKIQNAIRQKYPGEKILTWCGGGFLGRSRDAAVALHDTAQEQFRVVWVGPSGSIQELQTMPAFGAASRFELQCLDQQQAEDLQQTLHRSEAIRDFLHVPARRGALCYFLDQTEARCWSVDRKHALVDAGGWQT